MGYSPKVKYLDGLNDALQRAVLAKTDQSLSLRGREAENTCLDHASLSSHPRRNTYRRFSPLHSLIAAREMRERVRLMLGEDGLPPLIATFHGLGREPLESYGKAIGVQRFFSVYDRDDSERALQQHSRHSMLAQRVFSEDVLGRISRAKGRGDARTGVLRETCAVRDLEIELPQARGFDMKT